MIESIKKFWAAQDSLERRLFWMSCVVISACSFVCTVLTFMEDVGIIATIACSVCTVIYVGIGVFTYCTSLYSAGYLVLAFMMACVLVPMDYILCGGVAGGCMIYFMAGPTMFSLARGGRAKYVGIVVSVICAAVTVAISWKFPEIIAVEPSVDSVYADVIIGLVIVGFGIFLVTSYTFSAYQRECRHSEELVAKLDYLSKRDSLTDLYNRRYLMQYLENMVWQRRENFHIAMFDIDNFKDINEQYGRQFGELVICGVADLLQKCVDEKSGECAVRYGGESYIYIITGGSEFDAFAKADKFREMVSRVVWEKPMAHVTVSGGIVACNRLDLYDVRQVLGKVDELVSLSKTKGRNQVRSYTE